MIRHLPKKYCPLCKNAPTEKVADRVYKCIRCGFVIDEQKAQSAYHKQVLIAKPSIYGKPGQSRYFHGQKDEPTRSETFRKMRSQLENPRRYDKDSMYNPAKNLLPGRNTRTGEWMSVNYASMDADAVTPEKENELNKRLQTRRYLY